jgi:hydroxypyruvate reductase
MVCVRGISSDRPMGERMNIAANSRPAIVSAGNIPAELRATLEPHYDLIERMALERAPARGFQVAVTTSIDGADAALMDLLPDLRLIACNGAGLERIDLLEARRRGIAVCNTPDAVTTDTADYAIGLIYATLRRIVEADRFVRAGRWRSGRMVPSQRLTGKALGIIGLGRVGLAIAKRCAALDMSITYTTTRRKDNVPFEYVPTPRELAARSDILLLACSGGAATRGLVNAEILSLLGKNGILINISRGSVVDESALIEALERGDIACAGLDVFSSEPDLNSRLLSLENVVLSPHYAAVTRETRAEIAADLLLNINAFFHGGAVRNAAAEPPAS